WMLDLLDYCANQTVSDRGRGSRDYRDHHLRYLDLYLGLDECRQCRHKEYHDDLVGLDRDQSASTLRIRRRSDGLHHAGDGSVGIQEIFPLTTTTLSEAQQRSIDVLIVAPPGTVPRDSLPIQPS